MRIFLTALTGACFLIMTNTANADSGQTLLLETTKGQIEIKMLPELAPNHVARITELANSGFYDGVIFHRVIPGFMAQTGDPDGTGLETNMLGESKTCQESCRFYRGFLRE